MISDRLHVVLDNKDQERLFKKGRTLMFMGHSCDDMSKDELLICLGYHEEITEKMKKKIVEKFLED